MKREETKYEIKLKRLILDDFRPFQKLEVDFDENLTLFIGDNGAGKTTILDATAELLKYLLAETHYKDNEETQLGSKDVRNSTFSSLNYLELDIYYPEKSEDENEIWEQIIERNATIGFSINKETGKIDFIENEWLKVFKEFTKRHLVDDVDSIPVMIYFGSNMRDIPPFSGGDTSRYIPKNQRVYEKALTSERINFSAFYNWFDREFKPKLQEGKPLDKLVYDYKDSLGKVVNGLLTIINDEESSFSRIRMDYGSNGNALRFEKIENDEVIAFLDAHQMSAGQKSLIAMAGDIMRRLIEANPRLGNPLEGNGIILIDEIDLHLHPKWQRTILTKLQTLFPNIQLVVTSHSPFVVQSAQANSRFILDKSRLIVLNRQDELSYEAIVNDYFDIDKLFDEDSESLLEALQEYKIRILNSEITLMDTHFLKLLEKISSKSDEVKKIAARELRIIKKNATQHGKINS